MCIIIIMSKRSFQNSFFVFNSLLEYGKNAGNEFTLKRGDAVPQELRATSTTASITPNSGTMQVQGNHLDDQSNQQATTPNSPTRSTRSQPETQTETTITIETSSENITGVPGIDVTSLPESPSTQPVENSTSEQITPLGQG